MVYCCLRGRNVVSVILLSKWYLVSNILSRWFSLWMISVIQLLCLVERVFIETLWVASLLDSWRIKSYCKRVISIVWVVCGHDTKLIDPFHGLGWRRLGVILELRRVSLSLSVTQLWWGDVTRPGVIIHIINRVFSLLCLWNFVQNQFLFLFIRI